MKFCSFVAFFDRLSFDPRSFYPMSFDPGSFDPKSFDPDVLINLFNLKKKQMFLPHYCAH